MRTILLLALLLSAAPALAQGPPEMPPDAKRGAYVTVNVGIEMYALEQAAADTARATQELAAAVREMASSPTLSDEHRTQLMAVIGRVDQLTNRVAGAMERLPAAVQESREPLMAIAEDLAAQVRWTIATVVVLLMVMAAAALWGFYAFVLRPGRRLVATATIGARSLLHSLERAAEIVAGANAAQLAASLATAATPARAPVEAGSDAEPANL